jgi:hypothetical protein
MAPGSGRHGPLLTCTFSKFLYMRIWLAATKQFSSPIPPVFVSVHSVLLFFNLWCVCVCVSGSSVVIHTCVAKWSNSFHLNSELIFVLFHANDLFPLFISFIFCKKVVVCDKTSI